MKSSIVLRILAIDFLFSIVMLSHTPKNLVSSFGFLAKTLALSVPIWIHCSSLGREELITINSDFAPLILMSLSIKNSFDILMTVWAFVLSLVIHTVSSANAEAAVRCVIVYVG